MARTRMFTRIGDCWFLDPAALATRSGPRAVVDCPAFAEITAALKAAAPCLCCLYTASHKTRRAVEYRLGALRAAFDEVEPRGAPQHPLRWGTHPPRTHSRLRAPKDTAPDAPFAPAPAREFIRRCQRQCAEAGAAHVGWCARRGCVWFGGVRGAAALRRLARHAAARGAMRIRAVAPSPEFEAHLPRAERVLVCRVVGAPNWAVAERRLAEPLAPAPALEDKKK